MLAARSGMNLYLDILVRNIKRCQMTNKALDIYILYMYVCIYVC